MSYYPRQMRLLSSGSVIGAALLLAACSDENPAVADGGGDSWTTSSTSGGTGGTGGSGTGGSNAMSGPSTGGTGGGGTGGSGTGGSGTGGSGTGGSGGAQPTSLDNLLDALRNNVDAAMLEQSHASGWPALVESGYLVVSTDASLTQVAGDHDNWTGSAMTSDSGFSWVVLPLMAGDRYKLTDGATYAADPWGRAYEYDSFGVMTMLAPTTAHLERYLQIGGRTIRVWVPEGPATHVLYMHDGQNLFNPGALFGGWQLQSEIPAAMMVVGIDNTPARIDEYTHVVDNIGSGALGGDGDSYATYVNDTVRGLVFDHYGEPSTIGVMGSSLGGLISLHMADRFPNTYAFAGSMSGTAGWGSIGLTNQTIIERLETAGLESVAIYIDSGGSGTCLDSDGDGTDDDGTDFDNYCVNLQLASVLRGAGYTDNVDLWHWHEPDAPHNELAWGARVWRPLSLFAAQ